MAQRRMFSPAIVESDAFLDMPASSQALYFHLGMYADDDGFVNPQKIMRMMNAGADDLKVIITKRFVLPFENGVIVIKHWRINNLIRKDWYKETQYLEQKKLLKLKENGSYTELVNKPLTNRSRRLVKDSIVKDSIVSEASLAVPDTINPIIDLFKEINPIGFKKFYAQPPQRRAVENLLKEFGEEKLRAIIAFLPKNNSTKFAPTITTPIQLENKFADMTAFWQKEKGGKKEVHII